jgi:hypothetical protein
MLKIIIKLLDKLPNLVILGQSFFGKMFKIIVKIFSKKAFFISKYTRFMNYLKAIRTGEYSISYSGGGQILVENFISFWRAVIGIQKELIAYIKKFKK